MVSGSGLAGQFWLNFSFGYSQMEARVGAAEDWPGISLM